MLAGGPSQSPVFGAARASPIVLAHERPFRIGDAEFRTPTRELLFDDLSSIVEPRVMQLIVALHRAGGGVVSKDDLAELCWEGRIVGEDAINRVVSRARSVAEKQAGGAFRIETITKVGYRLVTDESEVATGAVPAENPSLRIRRRELVLGTGAVALAGAAGLAWTVSRRHSTPPEARLLIDAARKTLREGDLGSAPNAIGTLRHAAEIAQDSAEAWGLLALAYTIAAIDSTGGQRPDLQARASAAMKHAFALEPFQADALAAQARTVRMYRNWDAYEQTVRAALRHHPAHPELMVILAGMLMEVGRVREGLQLYERILPAMPLSTNVLTCHAFALLSLGMLEEADAAIDQAYRLLPRNNMIWNAKAWSLMYGGRPREALAMFLDVDNRPFGGEDLDYQLSAMQAKALISGDPKLIREAVETLVRTAESGVGFLISATFFAAFVGDLDQAFRLLNAFYFNRGFKVPAHYFNRAYSRFGGELHTAHLFDRELSPIRRDPRFAALTREIGLDGYWARTNTRSLVVA